MAGETNVVANAPQEATILENAVTGQGVQANNDSSSLLDESIKNVDSQKEADGSTDKEGSEKAKESLAPEVYEFKLPEGVEMDKATLELFSPIFKELNITNEGAQKLVDAYVPLIQGTIDRTLQESIKQFNEIKTNWKNETMKELGADAKTKIALCGKALNKFGGKELREILGETGVGNHKEVVKFMAKVGETITEDSLGDMSQQPVKSGDPLKTLYPSMYK